MRFLRIRAWLAEPLRGRAIIIAAGNLFAGLGCLALAWPAQPSIVRDVDFILAGLNFGMMVQMPFAVWLWSRVKQIERQSIEMDFIQRGMRANAEALDAFMRQQGLEPDRIERPTLQ